MSETLQIGIRNPNGEVTKFKVKNTTKMGKVMAAYASKNNLDITTIKFILDGERVGKDDTPKTLELEEGDSIDHFQEQVGGHDLK
jgi:small ubiquitin-related modifier